MQQEDNGVDAVKEAFLNLLCKVEGEDFDEFDSFVRSALDEYHNKIHDHHDMDEDSDAEEMENDSEFVNVSPASMNRLGKIISDLRKKVPVSAEAPGEEITIPKTEEYEGYTAGNTVHVDGFLFTEDDVDDLCDQGTLSRNYCLDCNSKNVKPLNFISHSASVLQLQFMYQVALANQTSGKTILDIGSRLGAVLYTGYLFSEAKKLIGVEINSWFHNVQVDTVAKYKMKDRIELVQADIQTVPQLIAQADIIVMNNVFQFFNDLDVQKQIWRYIRKETSKKQGLLIVTLPSLQDQLKQAGLPVKKTLGGWVKQIKLDYSSHWFESELSEDDVDEISQVHLYRVI
ncbi:hypothetical protein K450DRAFT_244026 [Umbelopsis ramanniana AG]|uniref:Methyltransferase type 11 domain-containing protein n=1 Tax=Umbelopsis ramanniana AG TaxID=1314678 RepID=A0AAD5E922_UMBRA|nr:uncharacterized protein K450DRAFT_244026 [Umbelopsis ramanniana AG]KAI8579129.1 hypothetical protein K450DRAFT_244026 [Umbelopsis ramanniana AG]